jgi:hypothetical protein
VNGGGQRYRIVDGIRVNISASPAADSKPVSSPPDSPEQLSISEPFCLIGEFQQPPPARTLRILARINKHGLLWLSLRTAGNTKAEDPPEERAEGRRDRVDFPMLTSAQSLIDALTAALRGAQALPVPLPDEAQEASRRPLREPCDRERRRSQLTLHSDN